MATLDFPPTCLPSRLLPPELRKLLMLNIIEATDVDLNIGVLENANIGIALAAKTDTAPYEDANAEFVWPFSKEWLDAYNVRVCACRTSCGEAPLHARKARYGARTSHVRVPARRRFGTSTMSQTSSRFTCLPSC